MRSKALIIGLLALALQINSFEGQGQFKIARNFQQPTRRGIHIVNLQTGKVRFIADFDEWVLSPDGVYIAGGRELRSSSEAYGIYIVPASGGKPKLMKKIHVLSKPSAPEFDGPYHPSIAWSRDCSKLIVKGDNNRDGRIKVTVIPSGHKARGSFAGKAKSQSQLPKSTRALLEKQVGSVNELVFSRDGHWAAATCAKGNYGSKNYSGGICVFRPDGSSLIQVTKNVSMWIRDADDREIQWLPNGKAIAFRRTSYEDEGI